MSSLSKYELTLFSNALRKTIEDDGATLYHNYSGRAMFGESCVGLVHSDSTYCVSMVMSHVHQLNNKNIQSDVDVEDISSLIKVVSQARIDNMGLDYIIYYPDVQFDELSLYEFED
jgi:hypothetical protein